MEYGRIRPKGWAQSWTPSSIMCYERKMICKGCFYENYFESGKCKCKYAAIELYKLFGKPPKEEEEKKEVL